MHASMGRNAVKPWRLAGGAARSNNYVELIRNEQVIRFARISYYPLRQGDLVRILTGSGGG